MERDATETSLQRRRVYPFGVKVTLLFFLLEGLQHIHELVTEFGAAGWDATYLAVAGKWHGLLIIFYLLITVLLFLNLQVGRIWGIIFLGTILAMNALTLTLDRPFGAPDLWLSVGLELRLQILATFAIQLLLLWYLNTETAKKVLRH